jgi:phage-related protein
MMKIAGRLPNRLDVVEDCRPLHFVGSSHKDLKAFPGPVCDLVGYALYVAQCGGKSPKAKPFKGVGTGVLEVVVDNDGNTYRAVYVVRLISGVYVLHCFQKKSKHGIKTPKKDTDLIKQRLAEAIEQDRERNKDHEYYPK